MFYRYTTSREPLSFLVILAISNIIRRPRLICGVVDECTIVRLAVCKDGCTYTERNRYADRACADSMLFFAQSRTRKGNDTGSIEVLVVVQAKNK